MVKNYGWVLTLIWVIFHACCGAPLGNTDTQNALDIENASSLRNQDTSKTQSPLLYRSPEYNPSHRYTKKSDMPEKGQIKFMKTLLGKVKTLLHREDDTKRKVEKEKKVAPSKIPDKIRAVASDKNSLYGVLGNAKAGEKSVNVISIPLNALKEVAKSEPSVNDSPRVKDLGKLEHTPNGAQVLLRPVSVRLASNLGENKGLSSLVPIVLPNQDLRLQPPRSYGSFLPDGPSSEPYGTSRVPFVIERHGAISRHSKGGEGLYRDIGHIPGEIRYHHGPSEDEDLTGETSLRHENPGRFRQTHPIRYHHSRDDDFDEDDEDDEDDDSDDDDYDDDQDDDDDDENDEPDYRGNPRMLAEERRIASTRKRLYDMLPGNDPTFMQENQGLGLPARLPSSMQVPEAFLGNPMVQPGVGFNQRNLMPSLGTALAGEHADNSNDRSVFMVGGQGPTKQVFGDSDTEDPPMRQSTMKVNPGGFNLGGSHAQAMSPNEVSYRLQNNRAAESLSEKDEISRPKFSSHKPGGVLLKVNGRPIGDSRELRDHIVNGVVYKGKEKVIKSKGPMDVKVSKATDGVHSKVVDITSADRVNVREAKSKVAKRY